MRLTMLAVKIRRLESELVHHEQVAFDLSGNEQECERAIAKAAETRTQREVALLAYFEENERLRAVEVARQQIVANQQAQIRALSAMRREGR